MFTDWNIKKVNFTAVILWAAVVFGCEVQGFDEMTRTNGLRGALRRHTNDLQVCAATAIVSLQVFSRGELKGAWLQGWTDFNTF